MRRILGSVATAAVLVLSSVGVVTAADPVTVTISGTSLVARGAAVDVTFDFVCQPYLDSTEFTIEYGRVHVDQAVSKKLMGHGGGEIWGGTYTCDGSTVNTVVVRVFAEAVPFRKGQAIASVGISLTEQVYWTWTGGEASKVVRLS